MTKHKKTYKIKVAPKTRLDTLELAKKQIEEIQESRLSPEEKQAQSEPYLKMVMSLDKDDGRKLYDKLKYPVGLGPGM